MHREEVADSTLDEMLAAARAIMPRAYVPYSHFHVGAALLNEDGLSATLRGFEIATFLLYP